MNYNYDSPTRKRRSNMLAVSYKIDDMTIKIISKSPTKVNKHISPTKSPRSPIKSVGIPFHIEQESNHHHHVPLRLIFLFFGIVITLIMQFIVARTEITVSTGNVVIEVNKISSRNMLPRQISGDGNISNIIHDTTQVFRNSSNNTTSMIESASESIEKN